MKKLIVLLTAIGLLIAVYSAWAGTIKATVSWVDNSTNEDGFKVERKVDAGLYSVLASVGPNVTSYVDSPLTPGSTYCYRIVAFNAVGDAAPSAEACATAPTAPQPAGTVTVIISVTQ